jgi:hypothetical protein
MAQESYVPVRRFQLLSRVCFWLLVVALGVYLAIFVVAKVLTSQSHRGGPSLDPKASNFGIRKPGQVPPYEIVAAFAEAVKRNTGRTPVPDSELPYPREAIERAILSAPQWARDLEVPGGRRLFGALLVDLTNFVSPLSSPTPEALWEMQKRTIESLGRGYRHVTYGGKKPIPTGEAHHALTQMLYEREAQYLAFLATFVAMGFMAFKLLGRLINRLRHRSNEPWSAGEATIFFLATSMFIGLAGYPVALLSGPLENATHGTPFAVAVGPVGITIGVLLPLLMLSGAFDVAVRRQVVAFPRSNVDAVVEGPAPKSDQPSVRLPYRIVAGLVALALWAFVIAVGVGFAKNPQLMGEMRGFLVFPGILAVVATVVSVQGQAWAWFMKRFGRR